MTAVTSEYSSGMIRTTFIVNPHRIRVGAAKALIVGILGVGIHAIAVPGLVLGAWILVADASQVPASQGLFDLDDYIDYLIAFLEAIVRTNAFSKAADEAGWSTLTVSDHLINPVETRSPYPYTTPASHTASGVDSASASRPSGSSRRCRNTGSQRARTFS